MPANYQEIIGSSAWVGAQISRNDNWIVRLSADCAAELDLLNGALAERSEQNPNKLNLPALQAVARRAHADLTEGHGFILIKGFPVDRFKIEDTEALYLAFGRLLGKPISQNSYGDLLTHVRDEGKKYKTTTDLKGARGYRSNEALLFHTDLGDVVGLLCMQKAVEGGRSSISSSMTVYNEAARKHPEYIPIYFNGFPLLNLEEGGDQKEYRLPVYSEHNGIISCAIRRNTIETAKMNGVHFTQLELDALAFLDDTAARDDIRFDMDLEPGDIQLINNFITLHSRTHFRDADDPKMKRDLIRLWVQLPDGRSFLRKFDTIYDGIPKTLSRNR
jgi:alpha-ketoglutarate-dependent taurine dioxygenase